MNPRWLEPPTFAGNVHLFRGLPDLALVESQRALTIDPSYGLANHFRGRALLAKVLHREAIAQLRKSNDLLGSVPFSIGDLGYALAVTGNTAEAETMLAELEQRRTHGYYPAFAIAQLHHGLGHSELALDWLERAADERNLGFYLPSADSTYDALRTNERFKKLMARAHLVTAAPPRTAVTPR